MGWGIAWHGVLGFAEIRCGSWVGMGWDGVGWGGVGWCGVAWDEVRYFLVGRDGLAWNLVSGGI